VGGAGCGPGRFAFLTKYLQAYLVLPAFALTWLVAAPGTLRRRLLGLLASGAAVVVASMWWVVLVELVPRASRPFIGGSPTNSAVQLLFGYDGLGRIFGGEGSAGRGPGGAGGFGGDPGLLRMFNDAWGGEVSWLLPGATIGLVAGLIARGRASRTDRRRAGFVLWGTWAIVHVLVFSLMTGIAHPYYAVALAPALAALLGGGIAELWHARRHVRWVRVGLAAMLVVTAAWAGCCSADAGLRARGSPSARSWSRSPRDPAERVRRAR
jgi:4-amino-4-deoxy-L-arabinose transferase-like glycosyltransferase